MLYLLHWSVGPAIENTIEETVMLTRSIPNGSQTERILTHERDRRPSDSIIFAYNGLVYIFQSHQEAMGFADMLNLALESAKGPEETENAHG